MDANNICAVIDAQGYTYGGIFYPREFAFVCKDFYVCFEVVLRDGLPEEPEVRSHFDFQKRVLHGLPKNQVLKDVSKTITDDQLKTLLLNLYMDARSYENNLVAIKNHQFRQYLGDINIEFYDLEEICIGGQKCPSMQQFDRFGNNRYCALHSELERRLHYRCALRKSFNIWRWINDKTISDKYFESMAEPIISAESQDSEDSDHASD